MRYRPECTYIRDECYSEYCPRPRKINRRPPPCPPYREECGRECGCGCDRGCRCGCECGCGHECGCRCGCCITREKACCLAGALLFMILLRRI